MNRKVLNRRCFLFLLGDWSLSFPSALRNGRPHCNGPTARPEETEVRNTHADHPDRGDEGDKPGAAVRLQGTVRRVEMPPVILPCGGCCRRWKLSGHSSDPPPRVQWVRHSASK
ncbi:hypothetical protein EXIGLDRAFT_245012 [Exidia glandulosa HHB12029]|uniref:Secreted protein n=1 Tax=Exidia glandulosa HHB12029 TaxID=1314781 RepID=A0A165Q9E0_EXIGL|nr:hypothetical protein EXIGLDRAFT_245012 [Exidia glandulosa HHB12029]